jgi:hypothetical protein
MSRFPKITETFVLFEMQALETLGARVEVFPLRRGPRGPRHDAARGYEERAHFVGLLSWRALASNVARLRRAPRRYFGTLWAVLKGTWGSPKFFLGALLAFPKCVYFAERAERLGVARASASFGTR